MKNIKRTVMTAIISVAFAAVAVYAAVNIVYNMPEESYPDPLQPIAASDDQTYVHTEASVTEADLPAIVNVTEDVTETDTPEATSEVTDTVTESTAVTEAQTETAAVTEAVTEKETEAVTTFVTEAVTMPVTDAATEAVTEAETEMISAEIEAEDRLRAAAKMLIGDEVDEAIGLVNDAKYEGSHETYPYEKQYLRQSLTESQKEIYDRIHDSVSRLEAFRYNGNEIGNEGIKDVRAAYEAFRLDYLQYSYYFKLDEVQDDDNTALVSHYFLPSDSGVTVTEKTEAILYDISLFEAVCDYIVESMPEDFSTYDKYRYLASVVSLCTVYDHNHDKEYVHDTPYGPLMEGLAICTGYTVSFEYLCERADLYCTRVWGSTYAGLVHMWNVVKLDSGTYHVDVTWSDSDRNTPCRRNWQIYYMLTQEKCLTDHVISDGTVVTGTEKFE